ncbi:MAG: MBL fold metallo-hydrolase [Steroidobacteraceae bacterium]
MPTIDTYVEIETWRHLRPGQPWSEGAELAARLRADYAAGRLALRRYPWRVGDGIYALGDAQMEQQTYLIDTGAGLLLVDPSLDIWQDEILGQIRALGFRAEAVKWVLMTHCHIDHGQSCHAWRQRGARILIGDGDAHPLETCNSVVATWVEPQANGRCTPCPVDERVHDGDVLKFGTLTVHAIATPGHTPGSTVFYFERGGRHYLVSGDIALHNGRHAWMGNPYADWGQYLASLGKLVNFSSTASRAASTCCCPATARWTSTWRRVWSRKRCVSCATSSRGARPARTSSGSSPIPGTGARASATGRATSRFPAATPDPRSTRPASRRRPRPRARRAAAA